MELHISELSELPDLATPKINVVKQNTTPLNKNTLKSILKTSAKIENKVIKPRVSYDDILAKMGMYVDNGKLHLSTEKSCDKPMECKIKCSRIKETISNAPQNYTPQNSYIYNKYFKEQVEEPLVPKTMEEYKQMVAKKLIENKIQRKRISQIKSTKLIMPTNNIHVAPVNSTNLNRLFRF
jgi:hypothetical protein